MRIEMPDGMWAEVRDIDQLTSKDRKVVNKTIVISVDDDDNSSFSLGMQDDMRDALLTRIITHWSFPLPLPMSRDGKDSLDGLSLAQMEALDKGIEGHMKVIRGVEDDAPDPKDSAS